MIWVAIDPGPVESAFVTYDAETRTPRAWDKLANDDMIDLSPGHGRLAIEMVASYGMPVGAEVFDTCVWIGRFIECWLHGRFRTPASIPSLIYRRDVKLHLCGNARAKDGNVRQAIIDRYGGKQAAIGLKATPGPLYGMTGDCWQALAVAITAAETTSLGFSEAVA